MDYTKLPCKFCGKLIKSEQTYCNIVCGNNMMKVYQQREDKGLCLVCGEHKFAPNHNVRCISCLEKLKNLFVKADKYQSKVKKDLFSYKNT